LKGSKILGKRPSVIRRPATGLKQAHSFSLAFFTIAVKQKGLHRYYMLDIVCAYSRYLLVDNGQTLHSSISSWPVSDFDWQCNAASAGWAMTKYCAI